MFNPINPTSYWQTVYHQPTSAWLPMLDAIRERHGLPGGAWERFALGRNVVFGCGELVVKLTPPFWAADTTREIAALQYMHKQLAVATPHLIAHGDQDGWRYLVQARVAGELLHTLWPTLPLTERAALAAQHGALMAALHTLPHADLPDALRFDWRAMLAEQRRVCAAEMRRAGVSNALLDDLEAYLATAQPIIDASNNYVLLHGDLNFLNLLVELRNHRWQITGLVDWGDAKIGPIAHELISPCVNMYRGARAELHAWYAGYGLTNERRTTAFEHHLMARTLMYYSDEFAQLLQLVPGARHCRCWRDVAACFWHFTKGETL